MYKPFNEKGPLHGAILLTPLVGTDVMAMMESPWSLCFGTAVKLIPSEATIGVGVRRHFLLTVSFA